MLVSFSVFLGLIFIITLMVMLGNKIKVAYPILLLFAGLGVSFFPYTPNINIAPQLLLLIVLPPLLYEAAWMSSWKEVWKWRRIIIGYAFIIVFITAVLVAFAVNHFIPGFSLALGFLLGGVVSPPDAVSTGAILKFVKVPKRIATILEGESLFNDASSLIIFRFALIAVGTGQFIWQEAAVNFLWMIFGGTGIGVSVAEIFRRVQRKLPTDPIMDVVLTIITPYIMYIIAENAGASGVMSVICGGFYLSHHQHTFLNSSARLTGRYVWQSFSFILNGLVFILIGSELPSIIEALEKDNIGLNLAICYGLLVSAVLIISRIIISYGVGIFTRVMSKFITVADARKIKPSIPFVIGWAGMRGGVSLTVALSIPLTLEDGTPFPFRSLILFITFIVICSTLVFQGLTLPFVIKKANIPEFNDHLSDEETEKLILKELAKNSINYLNNNYHQTEIEQNILLKSLVSRLEQRLQTEEKEETNMSERTREIYLNVLDQKRQLLFNLNNENPNINEDIINHFIHRIDLEEERLKHE